MAKSAYPDEVWLAIRTLWESVPKISWDSVLSQIGTAMKCEVPSISTVSLKAKRERWKKTSKKMQKKSENFGHIFVQGEDGKTQLETIGYDDIIRQKFYKKIDSESEQNSIPQKRAVEILEDAISEAETEQFKIIKQHRIQSAQLAESYQTLLDQADDFFDLPLDVEDEDFEEVANRQVKVAILMEKKTNIVLTLAQVGKLTQERVFKAWGITEVEDDRRVKARQQDIEAQEEELATSRAAMRSEQEKLCRERMAMVERGYFIERVEWEAD